MDRTVSRLVRRSRQAVFLGTFLRWTAGGFAVAGAAVLAVRATHTLDPPPPIALVLPVLLALGMGLVLASRRGLSREGAAAWVDVRAGGGGLVVTGLEHPDERWSSAFAHTVEDLGPLPGFRVQRPLGLVVGAGAFLAAALWVEIPAPDPGPSPELFEAIVASLADKLEALEENVDLEEDLATDLTDRLGRLQELLEEETTPESLFEALDGLEDRLGVEGERVRNELENAARDLASSTLDGLRDPGAALSALERALASMREAGIDTNLPESLRELLGAGLQLPEGIELSAAEMLQLAGELSELLQGRLGELAGAGLIDPAKLRAATEFADLSDFFPTDHECDENCEGGT